VVTDVIKWHCRPPASKYQIHDYQNKDRLSEFAMKKNQVVGFEFFVGDVISWVGLSFFG